MLRFGDLQVLTSKEICKSRNLKITKYITRWHIGGSRKNICGWTPR